MQSYQRIQCIGHTDFNTSGPNGPHSLLRMKGGTTRLCQQDRTQRLTRRNRGLPSLGHSAALCCQRNPFYSTVLLYTYISRFSVAPHYQQREKIRQSCRHKFYLPTAFHCVFQLLSQTIHVRFRTRKRVHTRLSEKNRTQGLTRRNRGVSDGGAPEERREPRNSDALMRVAVPRRRGPAGPRDLFRFCRNCGLYALCSELFACARRGALSLPSARFACSRNAGRPLVKTTCLPFSEVDGHCSPRDAYFLANIQVSLSVISVANVFALWYDKSHKSGLFGDEGEPE